MSFDFFQPRRNFNEHCRWWSRNESDTYEDNELKYKRVPNGHFFAKEVDAETNDRNIIGGIFMIDRTRITIESPDNLSDIKSNDIVEYQGEFWRVDNVQKKKSRQQNSEFVNSNNVSYYWYLSLIKE